MSDGVAVRLSGVGKHYRVSSSPLDTALDALGIHRLLPWRRARMREFWALREVDLEVRAGVRLGIIGRNGAGKSTLLKLIVGNVPPTEGEIHVEGTVQALLVTGAGFHPEFSGYENIRASLTYQGLMADQIEAAIKDIETFTELGDFLEQPFKTYSAGMQARLTFATATVLKPDILIIDEILGAGDAYFAGKSSERMRSLVQESGASVLLVSHAMDQIIQYCDECIWIERGRIVKRGPSMEVVNAYEGFIHVLEDQRLKAKNRKRYVGGYGAAQLEGYGDALVVAIEVRGVRGAYCDVARIELSKDDAVVEVLDVGGPQDADGSHMGVLALDEGDWSDPQQAMGRLYRRLSVRNGRAQGQAVFFLYHLFDDAHYAVRVQYRSAAGPTISLVLRRNGSAISTPVDLSTESEDWVEQTIAVARDESGRSPDEGDPIAEIGTYQGGRTLVRWPGEGSLKIEKAVLLGSDLAEKAVFRVGESLALRMTVRAYRAGHYELVPAATLYRLDGILVSNLIGKAVSLDLDEGNTQDLELRLGALMLGDGHFVFSLSIFEEVVALDGSTRYDLLARAYEFRVVGNEPLAQGAVFQHVGDWTRA
jgi:lipopolysaccharide transport system ATP-binding protein